MSKAILLVITSIILLLPFFVLFIIDNKSNNILVYKVDDCPIIHETKNGGLFIKITIDEFNDLSFNMETVLILNFPMVTNY